MFLGFFLTEETWQKYWHYLFFVIFFYCSYCCFSSTKKCNFWMTPWSKSLFVISYTGKLETLPKPHNWNRRLFYPQNNKKICDWKCSPYIFDICIEFHTLSQWRLIKPNYTKHHESLGYLLVHHLLHYIKGTLNILHHVSRTITKYWTMKIVHHIGNSE